MLSLQNQNKKALIEINNNEMNRFFSKINGLNIREEKLLYICISSNISFFIEELCLGFNKQMNIFRRNLKSLSKKEIRKIYVYGSTYMLINYISTRKNNEDYVKIEKNYFKAFNLSFTERKNYFYMQNLFMENPNLFEIEFIKFIRDDVFPNKKNNSREFAFIAFYLKESLNIFYKDYGSFNKHFYA